MCKVFLKLLLTPRYVAFQCNISAVKPRFNAGYYSINYNYNGSKINNDEIDNNQIKMF